VRQTTMRSDARDVRSSGALRAGKFQGLKNNVEFCGSDNGVFLHQRGLIPLVGNRPRNAWLFSTITLFPFQPGQRGDSMTTGFDVGQIRRPGRACGRADRDLKNGLRPLLPQPSQDRW